MFAKIINDKIVEYPYSIMKLKNENANISFPDTIENDVELLEQFNVVKLKSSPVPDYDEFNFSVELGTPEKIDGEWRQNWKIIELPVREKEIILQSKKQEAINLRNNLLFESDWTQLRDISDEIANKWASYRQALRDITSQEGFPLDIKWPIKP